MNCLLVSLAYFPVNLSNRVAGTPYTFSMSLLCSVGCGTLWLLGCPNVQLVSLSLVCTSPSNWYRDWSLKDQLGGGAGRWEELGQGQVRTRSALLEGSCRGQEQTPGGQVAFVLVQPGGGWAGGRMSHLVLSTSHTGLAQSCPGWTTFLLRSKNPPADLTVKRLELRQVESPSLSPTAAE